MKEGQGVSDSHIQLLIPHKINIKMNKWMNAYMNRNYTTRSRTFINFPKLRFFLQEVWRCLSFRE